MRNLFLYFIVLILVLAGCAVLKPVYNHDECIGKEIFLEDFTRAHLEDTVCFQWFHEGYEAYEPDEQTLSELKKMRKHISIVAVGGAWCSDTQYLLPLFYKTADKAGIQDKNIKLLGVDREKHLAGGKETIYKIDRVPTFILYYDGTEVGRIIETTSESIEKDMYKAYRNYLDNIN